MSIQLENPARAGMGILSNKVVLVMYKNRITTYSTSKVS